MSHRLDNMQAQRVVAGHSITTLARKANVSDDIIRRAENGGNIHVAASQRLADALGVSLATLGQSDI